MGLKRRLPDEGEGDDVVPGLVLTSADDRKLLL